MVRNNGFYCSTSIASCEKVGFDCNACAFSLHKVRENKTTIFIPFQGIKKDHINSGSRYKGNWDDLKVL